MTTPKGTVAGAIDAGKRLAAVVADRRAELAEVAAGAATATPVPGGQNGGTGRES